MKKFILVCIVIALALLAVAVRTYHRNGYFLMKSEGKSMTPCYTEGGMRKVYPNRIPSIGEGIAFKCNIERCTHPDGTNLFDKLVKKIKNNCIWVEGCSPTSFDSRSYGWLCGDEYKLIGLVEEYE
jgi:hypothetical protein